MARLALCCVLIFLLFTVAESSKKSWSQSAKKILYRTSPSKFLLETAIKKSVEYALDETGVNNGPVGTAMCVAGSFTTGTSVGALVAGPWAPVIGIGNAMWCFF